jgi:hypothetical protein
MPASLKFSQVAPRHSFAPSATGRAVIVGAVLLAHACVIASLTGDELTVQSTKPEPIAMTVELSFDGTPEAPAPSLAVVSTRREIEMPELPPGAFPEEVFEAPRIDEAARLDIGPYSARAQLEPGTVAAVLLLLEIGADGSVLSAEVVRGLNGDAANEAAIEYARETHWIPGRVDGEPRAMQASLTVILGEMG